METVFPPSLANEASRVQRSLGSRIQYTWKQCNVTGDGSLAATPCICPAAVPGLTPEPLTVSLEELGVTWTSGGHGPVSPQQSWAPATLSGSMTQRQKMLRDNAVSGIKKLRVKRQKNVGKIRRILLPLLGTKYASAFQKGFFFSRRGKQIPCVIYCMNAIILQLNMWMHRAGERCGGEGGGKSHK